MKVMTTIFDEALLIEPQSFGDHRGFFMESYNDNLYKENGISYQFVQDNQSLSREAGVLRGLHYQLNPKAQTKLIRVLTGAIYDVIVDIRKGSPTFGKWQGFILSEHNKRQLLVPKGFAHGFCTLVPDTNVFYKVDEFYSQENDRGILWNDPEIGIEWPVSNPILSEKDTKHAGIREAEHNFVWKEGVQ
ncbi:dTDP-4-dehydrorhamnose 3,5-epimerase [Pullulanibacillus sp. KACC 23026]|uniref:dTDP-4-dehydrorhamnose 3,5-epimerase n=1 Tax=Pullulanibacillus sp. KACC 23026 TaxID=3028315 RepID=UPI0023AEC61B|nr:dTDP-4-dehydrorhamnose 3,5-epimerase [Pullulanibacillus sp. KACC 23026]WEG13162.1 dTDP-4-dehydrorhamnose 3,5-epimerase [Pullulanibacillus sp. KACC 23026]